MKNALQTILGVAYFFLGILQFVFITAGVQDWLGVHWFFSAFVAFILAYMPVVGTVLGILGAVSGFGWNFPLAIIFFCWPYVMFAIALVAIWVFDLLKKHRGPREAHV